MKKSLKKSLKVNIFFLHFRFLYFTQDGEGKGLYRIDLADISQKQRVQPTQIVTINHLKAFMIDFETVRLYFPNHTQNTMLSSFVDGSDIQDIRPDVILPSYKHIISLTGYDNRFYWTNGSEMLSEEFDPRFEKYRHNKLLFFDKYYRGLNMYHPRMQPTPGRVKHWSFSSSTAYLQLHLDLQ